MTRLVGRQALLALRAVASQPARASINNKGIDRPVSFSSTRAANVWKGDFWRIAVLQVIVSEATKRFWRRDRS
jgi:hypothetical protein